MGGEGKKHIKIFTTASSSYPLGRTEVSQVALVCRPSIPATGSYTYNGDAFMHVLTDSSHTSSSSTSYAYLRPQITFSRSSNGTIVIQSLKIQLVGALQSTSYRVEHSFDKCTMTLTIERKSII